jgi:two-component system, OmpR family, phosphate regulon sensor histidine kinase PhoR
MNSAIVSELSLYQFARELDPSLPSVAISPTTLKSCVKTVLDLAIEQQLNTTVWVKSPQTINWLGIIQKYLERGNSDRVYLCTTSKDRSILPTNAKSNSLIHLKLIDSSWLQRESFLVVISPQFCALILAQWQKGKFSVGASGKRLQQPYLHMVSSFDPEIIFGFLTKIQEAIVPSRNVSSAAVTNFEIPAMPVGESKLLTNLLLKQIQHSEHLQISNDSLTQLSKSNTVLGLPANFLDNLAREIQSPITRIKTAMSLIESKQIKGEQRQRYLQMVNDECARQNSLVSGLLDLLQLDRPTEIERINIKLEDFVPGIVSTYQPLAEEKQIQLGYTIPGNLPIISCPTSWLRQIIVHLLNNSLQYTPPEGKVFVYAAVQHEYVELIVSDTGIGIEAKELTRIFDGFYRINHYGSDKIAGAGLGLTIVRQLVQRCGGSISVTSKPGKGSSFKVSLPIVPSELLNEE